MPARLAALAFALLALAAQAAAPAEQWLEGDITIVWIDAAPNARPAPEAAEYWLHPRGKGARTRLDVPAGLKNKVNALDRRAVRVKGAKARGRFKVSDLQVDSSRAWPAPTESSQQALPEPWLAPGYPVIGKKPWINLLCKFADRPTTTHDTGYFTTLFSSTRPGLDYYWKEQSNGQMSVAGSRATGWYTLPQPYNHYVYDAGNNGVLVLDSNRAMEDCLAAADADVHFPDYAGINLVFNDSLGCCAYGGATYVDRDATRRLYGVTWLPNWAWQRHTVMAHEMGHGFGLMHSRGNNETYRNPWDVMSDMYFNCHLANDPVIGCLGQHTIAHHKRQLGWMPDAAVVDMEPGTQTVRLEKLERPAAGLTQMIRIPIDGDDGHFYTVETRRRYSYDTRLPGNGVVIHEVSTPFAEAANVVDGDANGSPYDDGTRWLPGETFTDPGGISISVDQTDGSTGYLVTVTRPNTLIFKDDFESGGVLGWSGGKLDGGDVRADPYAAMQGSYGLVVDIDDNNQAHLTDHSPVNERTYRGRFLFSGNQVPMLGGDRFTFFGIYTDNALIAMLELRKATNGFEARIVARQDDGSTRNSAWTFFDNNGHRFQLEWVAATAAGANNGRVKMLVDDWVPQEITGLDTDTLRVERTLMGAVTGVDSGTRGVILFDDFTSTRF